MEDKTSQQGAVTVYQSTPSIHSHVIPSWIDPRPLSEVELCRPVYLILLAVLHMESWDKTNQQMSYQLLKLSLI
jgi:hypothetical protein